MIYFQSSILILLSFIVLSFLAKKFDFLLSEFTNKHQELIGSEKIPLIGGSILFIFLIFNFQFFDKFFLITSFTLLVLGIFSDLDYLSSPKKRLLFQFIAIISFVLASDLFIDDLRVKAINEILQNDYCKFFFISFCFLILINGSNFIDGCNGLNIGYFLSIILIIFLISDKIIFFEDKVFIKLILFALSILLALNFFNLIYLGDSGAYLLGFISGFLLVEIYRLNEMISPFFIALLLWYPAFENLFSIIRKKKNNLNPIYPDTFHFHHLLFKFLNKKLTKMKKFSNQITSLLINLFNLMIFFISINIISNSKLLIILLIFNVVIYLFFYFVLKKSLIK